MVATRTILVRWSAEVTLAGVNRQGVNRRAITIESVSQPH